MQVNYNYNFQECIGGPTNGFVKRNLWSWLESAQLRPDTKLYDQFSGVWYDNWIFGNNAIVTGSLNPNLKVNPNTGSFGGYNIQWINDNYMYWPNASTNGQPLEAGISGSCIFIQWQPLTTFTQSVNLFNDSRNTTDGINNSWWGGNNLTDGNTYGYLGWPNANDYTTTQALQTGSTIAPYIYSTPPATSTAALAITAWNSGVGYGTNGTQVALAVSGQPYYFKDNSSSTNGFNFTTNRLQFGKSNFVQYPFQGPNTAGQSTQPFKGNVKRILVYNSVLSKAEITRNFNYLQTLP